MRVRFPGVHPNLYYKLKTLSRSSNDYVDKVELINNLFRGKIMRVQIEIVWH